MKNSVEATSNSRTL